jgi:hypothetical protein
VRWHDPARCCCCSASSAALPLLQHPPPAHRTRLGGAPAAPLRCCPPLVPHRSQPSTVTRRPNKPNPNLDTFPYSTAPINPPSGEAAVPLSPPRTARPALGLHHRCRLLRFVPGDEDSETTPLVEGNVGGSVHALSRAYAIA